MLKNTRILIFAGDGIGGTEKCASLFARELTRRGYLVGYVSNHGPRVMLMEKEGVKIIQPTDDPEEIAIMISRFGANIIHQHVSGYQLNNQIYKALRLINDPRIKLIETNIFGRFEDPEGLELVDYRMFVSGASAVQAFRRVGRKLSLASLGNNIMVYNPMPAFASIINADEISVFRRDLGVREDEILFYRIGQPGHKWTEWEFKAFKLIRKQIPKSRLLLMEPPPELWAKIEPVADSLGIILMKASSDFTWMEKLNQSADISIHASAWGESFGYTIAEAMLAGSPVITRSTPWGDNAQVELIENGKTGFICCSVLEMAKRGIDLACSQNLRENLGEAGKARIQSLASLEQETDVLESVIESVMTNSKNQLLLDREESLYKFATSFVRREFTFSEPLTTNLWNSAAALLYMGYKSARSWIRNLKGRHLAS